MRYTEKRELLHCQREPYCTDKWYESHKSNAILNVTKRGNASINKTIKIVLFRLSYRPSRVALM